MNICFAPKGILQIDDIDGRQIIFKNFEGRGDKFNREGDRNFSLRIDDETLPTLWLRRVGMSESRRVVMRTKVLL